MVAKGGDPRKSGSVLGRIQGNIEGIDWPPVSTGLAAILSALVARIEDAQWSSPDEIAGRQREQLVRLAAHCAKHSRQFRARLAEAKLTPDDLGEPGGLARLPLLSRRDLQAALSSRLYCAEVPRDHLPVTDTRTSGSTGEPVTTRRTNATQFFWLAMVMRDHLWHRRDFRRRLAAVRATVKTERGDDWGPPASLLFRTGPSLSIHSAIDLKEMLALLNGFQPDSLLIYPNLLAGLIEYCRERDRPLPVIRHIRTTGETLTPELREAATAQFNAKVEDCYSSQELGYIALECPDSGLYHVMAESVLVEVLNEQGRPCGDGEIGRLVVTDLHNFATPLIRYDIGDYAEVAGPCPCGRGLPTLRRIMGRERNLMLMPDGSHQWPRTGFGRFREHAPVQQFQFVQLDRETIEVRLVTETTLSTGQEENLRAHILRSLGHPFQLRLVYFPERIPLGANGKFEDFLCQAR